MSDDLRRSPVLRSRDELVKLLELPFGSRAAGKRDPFSISDAAACMGCALEAPRMPLGRSMPGY
jgi:hypothetical protein